MKKRRSIKRKSNAGFIIIGLIMVIFAVTAVLYNQGFTIQSLTDQKINEFKYQGTDKSERYDDAQAVATIKLTKIYDVDGNFVPPFNQFARQKVYCSGDALYVYENKFSVSQLKGDWGRYISCGKSGCSGYTQKFPGGTQLLELQVGAGEVPRVAYVCWDYDEDNRGSWAWVWTGYSFYNYGYVVDKVSIEVQDLRQRYEDTVNRITSLETTLQEKTQMIKNLDLDIGRQIEIINQLQLTQKEQAKMIDELHSDVQSKALIIVNLREDLEYKAGVIKELQVTVEEKAEVIKGLNLKISEQARVIKKLEMTIAENADLMANLNETVEQQAELINQLAENIAEKAEYIKQLRIENDVQAQLVAQMESSFDKQKGIIELLGNTVDEDREIIDELEKINSVRKTNTTILWSVIIVLVLALILMGYYLRRRTR